jgi:prepilin-type N-terminal cleavage/methylation domain-containing protein
LPAVAEFEPISVSAVDGTSVVLAQILMIKPLPERRVCVNILHVNFALDSHGIDPDPSDDGFTLIEVLIVIVVLGVLATLVVFSVRGITDRGQTTACNQDARILATAVEAYFTQHGGGTIVATGVDDQRFERTLQSAALIRDMSDYWNVAAEGYLQSVAPC